MAVEAAITFSALMMLLFGIVQFGFALWQANTMMLAVQQAARYAMVNNESITPALAETQMQAVLTSASVCTTPTAGQICVNATRNVGPPKTMTLTAAYDFNLVAFVAPFTMTSQATVPLY